MSPMKRTLATIAAVATVIAAWLTWRWHRIPTDDGLWLEQPPNDLPPYLGSDIPPFYMGYDLRGRVVFPNQPSDHPGTGLSE